MFICGLVSIVETPAKFRTKKDFKWLCVSWNIIIIHLIIYQLPKSLTKLTNVKLQQNCMFVFCHEHVMDGFWETLSRITE